MIKSQIKSNKWFIYNSQILNIFSKYFVVHTQKLQLCPLPFWKKNLNLCLLLYTLLSLTIRYTNLCLLKKLINLFIALNL